MAKNGNSFRWTKNWYLLSMRSNHFLGTQWAGGFMLVIFAAVALLLANWGVTKEIYAHLLHTDAGFNLGDFRFSMSLEHWVNDALMVLFFFVVGLEIKREIVAGELSHAKKAALPIAAALGGMVVPALIYAVFNKGTQFEAGWGIPMATDIAFAIAVLSILGKRVPVSLKIFLTALAIVDDLGAILVIAIFYTSSINFTMLGIGLVILAFLFWLNKRGFTYPMLYIIPGIFVWYALLNSGIHATIAGVLLAMAMPTKPRFSKKYFSYKVKYFLEEFKQYDRPGVEVLSNHHQFEALAKVDTIARATASPAQRLEHILNPFVTFFVMPVFALANAGVEMDAAGIFTVMGSTQFGGIFLGLVLGKPIGIFLFCWLMVKLRLGVLPKNSNWGSLFGVACLGGIGFTMSIFIANLAFSGTPYIDTAKIAVLLASVTAGIIGSLATYFNKKAKDISRVR